MDPENQNHVQNQVFSENEHLMHPSRRMDMYQENNPEEFPENNTDALNKFQTAVNSEALKSIHEKISENIGERVESFARHTTLHGLSHALSSSTKWAKYFWITVLVIVVVVVSMQLHKLIAYFMQNPTVTSINVIYPEEGLPFPSLTVCILSKLNRTTLEEKYPTMPKKVAEFSMASFISAYSTALMDIGYFYRQNIRYRDTSFHCRGQFLLCWFENGHIFDCCDPNVELRVKRYLLHSGPCFEFQAETLKQRLPGPVGGFGFAYWYPNKDMFASVFNSYDEHAVHLFTSPTEAMLEKNPIVLPVGSHVHISLQATKTTRLMADQLGRPTCVEPTLKYFNYSYAACQAECLIDNMLDRCNCSGITTYGRVPQNHVCTPKEAFKCYEKLAYNFTNILSSTSKYNRKIKCREACEYWSYQASQTVGKVFNPILQKQMVDYWRLPNTSDPKLSLIFADVYFNDIEYTDVQQMPAFNIETFISSIGGAMGLWTGASIVTWIHLLFFCISSICKQKQKRQTERVKQRKASILAELHSLKLAAHIDVPRKRSMVKGLHNAFLL